MSPNTLDFPLALVERLAYVKGYLSMRLLFLPDTAEQEAYPPLYSNTR